MIKSNPCKLCSSTYHTAAFCPKKPKKAIKRKTIKQIPKKKKTESRSQLVKKLDTVFSQYIRLRDKDKGCVTCGVMKDWKEMQNCHFYSRGRLATRWDETNCHSGCYRCNVLLKGNYIKYTMFMIEKYGMEYVSELEIKSQQTVKIPTSDLKLMIETYKKRVTMM